MSPADLPSSAEPLLTHLRELATSERNALLQRLIGDDPELRRQLESFLRRAPVQVAPEETLTPSAMVRALESALEQGSREEPGARIGSYTLLEKIGEGGFGVVWLAEQAQPMQRRVAIKIIRFGMDTREVNARFEVECQALALMEHPNIARVLEAGATENGRPYFVMELVQGIAITRFCDENRLSAESRLRLFLCVCHAVQHAHQKGVIHRDLKPSNILVRRHDGEPVPKIIDFGIAKATQGPSTADSQFTQLHAFLGTPAYASPEQMEMGGLNIDTRSDIYSLGVLLYELLAGQPPYDPETLARSGLDAMRRMIREVDPPRPSSRLASLGTGDRMAVAERCGTDPGKLLQLLRGDLDWIVMQCLEKNPGRRYETASALAADIQRQLDHQPVTARPPSVHYQLGKLVRRHRLAFAAGSVVALALVAGLTMTVVSLVRERAARTRETTLREEANASATIARREAAKSAQVAVFMKDIFNGVGPSRALGRDTVMLRESLDRTARRLETELRDQPAVTADLRETLGTIYRDLGELATSETMFRGAVQDRRSSAGPENAGLASALDGLGETLRRRNKPAEAESALRDALALRRKLFGEHHPAYAETLFHLALLPIKGRKFDDMERMLREVLAIRRNAYGNEHRTIADTLTVLGTSAGARSAHQVAIALHAEALAMYRRLLDPEDPAVAQTLKDLGHAQAHVGHRVEAMQTYREAFDIHRKVLGEGHPKVATAFLRSIEQVRAGADAGVIAFVRDFIAGQRRKLPPGSPTLAPSLLALAAFLESKPENLNEVVQLRNEAILLLENSRTNGPPLDIELIAAMEQFAWWRHNNQALAEGVVVIEETVKIAEAAFGPDGHGALAPNRTLAFIYFGLHRTEAAIAQFEKAVRLDRHLRGASHVYTCVDTAMLAAAYSEAGRFADGRRLLESFLATWDQRKPDDPPPPTNIAVARAELGITLNRMGEFGEAERVLRQSLVEYDVVGLPPLSARNRPRERAEAALGWALGGQGRFTEAEPILLHAYQSLQSSREILCGDAAWVLRNVQDTIASLYEAWEKPDKAAEWRTL